MVSFHLAGSVVAATSVILHVWVSSSLSKSSVKVYNTDTLHHNTRKMLHNTRKMLHHSGASLSEWQISLKIRATYRWPHVDTAAICLARLLWLHRYGQSFTLKLWASSGIPAVYEWPCQALTWSKPHHYTLLFLSLAAWLVTWSSDS